MSDLANNDLNFIKNNDLNLNDLNLNDLNLKPTKTLKLRINRNTSLSLISSLEINDEDEDNFVLKNNIKQVVIPKIKKKILGDDYQEISTLSDPSEFYNESHFSNGYEEGEGHTFIKHERSILPSLIKYPFPDNIKKGADIIFNKMHHQVRRGKMYNMLLYYCVYCSYLEEIYKQHLMLTVNTSAEVLGYVSNIDPLKLGKEFGLTKSQIQKCDSIFAPLQTGYKPPYSYTPPTNYLPIYCKEIGLSQESITEILLLANYILSKDPSLYQDYPQTVAVGIFYYYTIINGIIIDDINKLIQLTGCPMSTIERISKRITIIDNS